MKKLVGMIVTLGVMWGIANWAGDNKPLFTQEWFDAIHAKVTDFQRDSAEYIDTNVPEPGEIVIPIPPAESETASPQTSPPLPFPSVQSGHG
jgi:hypothetical protein